MAYYSKEEVRVYVEENSQDITNAGIKPLTPMEQSISQIENEEDVVGFWWIELIDNERGGAVKPKMKGKTFIRIVHDLYTDDRFAADMYQAGQEGVSVSKVVLDRREESEKAQKEFSKDGIELPTIDENEKGELSLKELKKISETSKGDLGEK